MQPQHIVTSPSELILADDCSRARNLKYGRRLRPAQDKRSPTLASGTAVHYAVELICRNYGGIQPDEADLVALGEECLADEFRNDDDGGTANVKKFLPGVTRALSRIPKWLWAGDWLPERDLVGYFDSVNKFDEPWLTVELHGRPDLYRIINDEAPTVEIIDVKTTETDPLQFLLWSPQLRMYAAMLAQTYPEHLIVYRYVCVPTGVKSVVAEAPAFIFTPESHEKTVTDIIDMSLKLGSVDRPRYSRRCSWGEFAPICTASITGADPEGIIEELYTVREERKVLTNS